VYLTGAQSNIEWFLIKYILLIYKQKKPLNAFRQREVEVKQSFNEEELL
jgi:hypothetical protein